MWKGVSVEGRSRPLADARGKSTDGTVWKGVSVEGRSRPFAGSKRKVTKPVRRLGGLIFFVTTNLAHRSENLFQNRDNAEIVRACLFDFCEQMKYSIYAWVVMPDHAHAIIEFSRKRGVEKREG